MSDELPIHISESKSDSERMSAAAKKEKENKEKEKEKLARIIEMLKPQSRTSQKSFAWDFVVSDDSKKDEKR